MLLQHVHSFLISRSIFYALVPLHLQDDNYRQLGELCLLKSVLSLLRDGIGLSKSGKVSWYDAGHKFSWPQRSVFPPEPFGQQPHSCHASDENGDKMKQELHVSKKRRKERKKVVTRNSRANWPFWLPFGDFFPFKLTTNFLDITHVQQILCVVQVIYLLMRMLPYFLSSISKCFFWALLRLSRYENLSHPI